MTPEDRAVLLNDAAWLRAESRKIQERLLGVQTDAASNREAQRATLNLLEDAIAARDAARRESTERQRAEQELAAELAATNLLQQLSSQLIREERGDTFYQQIVETAIMLMRSA